MQTITINEKSYCLIIVKATLVSVYIILKMGDIGYLILMQKMKMVEAIFQVHMYHCTVHIYYIRAVNCTIRNCLTSLLLNFENIRPRI